MTNVEKLKKFIKENKLEFNAGSGGDINILAICGYACYIETSEEDLINSVDSEDSYVNKELERVYDYAVNNNYAAFWSTDDAKKQWNYEEFSSIIKLII